MLTNIADQYLYHYNNKDYTECAKLCSVNLVIQSYKEGLFSGPSALQVYFRNHKPLKVNWDFARQIGPKLVSVKGRSKGCLTTRFIKIFFLFNQENKIEHIMISKLL